MTGLIIEKVQAGSIAEELEIEPGDCLIAINGHIVRDIIDYQFHVADHEVLLEIAKPDGEHWELEVEKEGGEPLGLVFAPPVPAQCGNKCIFCFVHQLPRGLRSPLYVKDEDYRLSFLYGNYITLANIDAADLSRIKEQRLSPLYVSVHATDPAVREKMLGKRENIPVLEILGELAAARITMHAQVVLCPGINDGAILEGTVDDLASLSPWIASLAVVPVGLTSHRRGLPLLQPVTDDYAAKFVAFWQPRQRSLAERLGGPFLFLADEFYLKADLPFPHLDGYGDLPQLENGVGMIPLFLEEAREVLARATPRTRCTVIVVTGESPYPYLVDFLRALQEKTGVRFTPVPVKNLLFGNSVTVTGLVAGRDIVEALRGRELGDVALIPDVMLKEGAGVFLDDLTVGELEEALGIRVVVVEATPQGIYGALA